MNVNGPLKTSPRVYSGWGLWEMRVVAKSVRLQRVQTLFFLCTLHALLQFNSISILFYCPFLEICFVCMRT